MKESMPFKAWLKIQMLGQFFFIFRISDFLDKILGRRREKKKKKKRKHTFTHFYGDCAVVMVICMVCRDDNVAKCLFLLGLNEFIHYRRGKLV